MKNWLTRVAAIVLITAAFTSCDKDEDRTTVAPSDNLTLTASGTPSALTQATSAQIALTYTWNPVTFSLNGADDSKAPVASYQLQVAKASDGFGYPVTIDAGTGSTKDVTVEQLNSALMQLGFAPDEPATAFVRLVALVGTSAQAFVSAPVSLTATPYKLCPQPAAAKAWSIIGAAAQGWDTDVILTYDCDSKTFSYTGPLKADEFKFRYGKAWDTNLGGKSSTGGDLTQGGDNLKIATAGTYTITLTPVVDSNGKATGTFTIE